MSKTLNTPTHPPLLIDSILSATADDLQAIDERITVIVNEIAEKQKAVAGLQAIRKVVDIRLNGKAPQLSDMVFDLLTKEGSMPVPAIAERLGKSPAVIGMAIGRKSEWFRRENGEVHIARAK